MTHPTMTDHDIPEPLSVPLTGAESADTIAVLIEQAAEHADLGALRELAAAGHPDAIDQLVETATELEDLDELRRLAGQGNTDAAEILAELEPTGSCG
ncbi:hypothetical protein AB0D49_36270 [Streptomyces sp. NPDC048290]|uniref:hypothetical protein n=1 Tax=Streptomyces sp. NPDC048290 TaxID=3155811 RepID=UPI003437B5B5